MWDSYHRHWTAQTIQVTVNQDTTEVSNDTTTEPGIKFNNPGLSHRPKQNKRVKDINDVKNLARLILFVVFSTVSLVYSVHAPWTILEDKTILLQRAKVVFKFACFFFAIYMTIIQVARYLEDKDAPVIKYRKYNQAPRDKYPTFSICFKGTHLYWYHDEKIFDSYGVTESKYEKIQWRNNMDEYNAWCEGKTGYPIVDAGMRQMYETGWMHNRIRMVVAVSYTHLRAHET